MTGDDDDLLGMLLTRLGLEQGAGARAEVLAQVMGELLPYQEFALFALDKASGCFQPLAGCQRYRHSIATDHAGDDRALVAALPDTALTPDAMLGAECRETPLWCRLSRAAPGQSWQFAHWCFGDGMRLLVALREPLTDATDGVVRLLGAALRRFLVPELSADPERVATMLAQDPCPAVLCDAQGQVLLENQAAGLLVFQLGVESPLALLPDNHDALRNAALRRHTAIAEVEADVAGRILLWSYIPFAEGSRLLLRGRDATAQRRAARWSRQVDRIHRLITENTTDLISRHDRDGVFLYASPASLPLLGRMPGELDGKRLQSLMHPDDREREDGQAQSALTDRGFHTMTCRLQHGHGDYRWFEIAIRAVRDTYSGEIVELVCISRDVTKRHRAEEETRRLADVVAATTDLVLFTDADGRVLHFNRAAGEALGLTHPLRDPVEAAEFVGAESRETFLRLSLPEALSTGVWRGDLRLEAAGEGGSFPVSMVVLAHAGDAGTPEYCSIIARDMTDRERHEAQARQHHDELAHAARLSSMGELASGIAHEMNQPLASIINYAQACRNHLERVDEPDREHLLDGLGRIHDRATHAGEVIRRLRAFVRKGQRQVTAVSVETVVQDVLGMVDWEARRSRVTIERAIAPWLPAVVADRVLLEQVIMNLIRNGIEATEELEPGVSRRVTVAAEADRAERGVALVVTDNGPGLSADGVEAVFEPFQSSKREGLGLGLTISRSIIEQLGGTLTGEQGSGSGMTFRVALPAWTQREEKGRA